MHSMYRDLIPVPAGGSSGGVATAWATIQCVVTIVICIMWCAQVMMTS